MKFSAGEAGPSSLTVNGSEWVGAPRARRSGAPPPTMTAAAASAERHGLAADVYLQNLGFAVLQKSADGVQVRYTYGVLTVPGAKAELTYTVEPQGTLLVEAVHHGVPGAPELPCFGVKFQTFAPWPARSGPASGETYRIAAKAASLAAYERCRTLNRLSSHRTAACMWAPVSSRWSSTTPAVRRRPALTIEQADAPFAFSALPNTAQEIEAAQHITELPATGRNDDPGAARCASAASTAGAPMWRSLTASAGKESTASRSASCCKYPKGSTACRYTCP